jgi:PIN domain nuclease of toxin-antitoxin system
LAGARVILDTHVLLWLDRNDAAIGPQTRSKVEIAWRAGALAVSAITFWEAAMLAERGRITLPVTPERWRMDWLDAGLTEIPIDGHVALLACRLDDFHRDPADRFIVATALDQGDAPLLTADRLILDWRGKLPRFDPRA